MVGGGGESMTKAFKKNSYVKIQSESSGFYSDTSSSV